MTNPKRDVYVAAGMFVSAASAAVSSFDGLRSLALLAGWSAVMSPLLPLTIDAYAMSATRVWLADSTASDRARRFARRNAVGAIFASLLGNAMYHAIAAGLVQMTWAVVVVVGGIPPVVLGLVSHLAVLHKQSDPSVLQSVPGTDSVPADGTRQRTEDGLLTAARTADLGTALSMDGRSPETRFARSCASVGSEPRCYCGGSRMRQSSPHRRCLFHTKNDLDCSASETHKKQVGPAQNCAAAT